MRLIATRLRAETSGDIVLFALFQLQPSSLAYNNLTQVRNDSLLTRGHDSVGRKRDVDFRSSHAVLPVALQ
jgi:hypothetical protein